MKISKTSAIPPKMRANLSLNRDKIKFLLLAITAVVIIWTCIALRVMQDRSRAPYFVEHFTACSEETIPFDNDRLDDIMPTIYFVTPTYPRREQFAELVRLAQTLMHVDKLHWIVADDNVNCNPALGAFLRRTGLTFTHISSPMPEVFRSAQYLPRGVSNRRAALHWIQQNIKDGVLYFGDDDNSYDLKLFDEIRTTTKVSMFPVGLVGRYAVSTPVVKADKVIGFVDSWLNNRLWPVDMAGFAVNIEYLRRDPKLTPTMPYKGGSEETDFLESIGLVLDDVEPKASNCTKILVWHTSTVLIKVPTLRVRESSMRNTGSLGTLFEELENMGVVRKRTGQSAEEGIDTEFYKNGGKPIVL